MKKIWQKSLASMVSAALCLTAFVGCLTVNAATVHTGTIKSNGVAVATTATEAKLDVAVSVSNVTPGIAYTGLKATTDFGTLKGVEIKSGEVKVEELSTDGVTSIPAIDENGSFIIAAIDTLNGANDYVLTLTFAKNASVELVEGAKYPVTITYLGSKDVGAANWNEDPIGFNVAVKDITVTAATEPQIQYGTADVNWNGTSTASYHKFNVSDFSYQKDYIIRTAYYTSLANVTDVSYKFVVKGNGFNIEWGDNLLLDRTGFAKITNLSVANLAYDIKWQLVISYTDLNGVKHIDTSEEYLSDPTVKVVANTDDKSVALATLIETWKANDAIGNVDVADTTQSKEYDMTADIIGEADVNWASTQAGLVAAHVVRVSNFSYTKDYLIRTAYYSTISAATNVSCGFIVSGNGFSVQWEDAGLPSRTGFGTLTNLNVVNMQGDITWKMYIRYTDAEGKTHIDYSTTTTNFITKLNNNGYATDENTSVIDAFKSFYEVWSV